MYFIYISLVFIFNFNWEAVTAHTRRKKLQMKFFSFLHRVSRYTVQGMRKENSWKKKPKKFTWLDIFLSFLFLLLQIYVYVFQMKNVSYISHAYKSLFIYKILCSMCVYERRKQNKNKNKTESERKIVVVGGVDGIKESISMWYNFPKKNKTCLKSIVVFFMFVMLPLPSTLILFIRISVFLLFIFLLYSLFCWWWMALQQFILNC